MIEARSTGASTFSVAFELDDASRRQLTALLTAARAAKVTIKPPPPRATRRFVVEWPVCLGTMRGAMKADALDISTTGMFVRPVVALTLDTVLELLGRARRWRRPGRRAREGRAPAHATPRPQACGLAPGFGLSIVEMSSDDRVRWIEFIARIERRADKRVLDRRVARSGSPSCRPRSPAAGYAVMGGTDPGALVQLANADTRPVDAALIDASWLGNGASASWVESLVLRAQRAVCDGARGYATRARAGRQAARGGWAKKPQRRAIVNARWRPVVGHVLPRHNTVV